MIRQIRTGGVLWGLLWMLTCWATAQQQVVIRGGTLIDVRDGSLRTDTVIVVEGDRVVSVATGGPLPAGGTILDATGKYILPGLIDLHVHYDEWAAELYLNHGVTTVVDLGNAHEWIRAQREGIEKGFVPGPRLFHGTENLDGPSDNPDDTKKVVRVVAGPEDARRAMREYLGHVQAVKVYDRLSPATLRAIVAEAQKDDLPVIGHFRDVRDAIQAGAHGIEHTTAVANAVADQQALAEAREKVRKGFRVPSEAFLDEKKLPEIVQLMVEKGLYLNPTLRMSWEGDRSQRELGFHYQDFDLLINDWRLRYVPLAFRLAVLKEYQEIGVWHWADLSQQEQDLFHRGYQNASRIVKAFVDAGGKLYAGTDSAHMCTPGLALHQELELIVKAGVGELQALQAATLHSAELMRMQDRLGTLREGSVADLLILDANPLEDIHNTRKIWKVISRGRVLEGEYDPNFKNPIPRNYWEDSSHYFPAPEIQEVSPEVVVEGVRDVTLTVRGTGFIPYSIVQFDGVKLKTEWLDGFQLRAEVPAELLSPGTYAVTVENPDFAGGSVSVGQHLAHLGIRDHVSNEFLVLVKLK